MDSNTVNNEVIMVFKQLLESNDYQGDSRPQYIALKWDDNTELLLSIN